MYILNITRREKNPKWDPSDPNILSRYNQELQTKYLDVQVLNMEVTYEQFDAIRKAALENAK